MSTNITKAARVRKALGEQGMASILITMITMIVISLIVLGFAAITRREQSNTLDQQLSTQAFYAAETAVNDARNIAIKAANADAPIPGKANCTTYGPGDTNYSAAYAYPTGAAMTLDAAHNVSYTCLLVNPTPSTLEHDSVDDNHSWVVPVTTATAYDTIKIQWVPSGVTGPATTNCPTSTSDTFSPTTDWTCDYGVLRMDLVPTTGALTEGGLASSQLSGFFEPLQSPGAGSLSYVAGKGFAHVTAANCTATCNATITVPSATSYTLRLASLYNASDITVTAYNGGTQVDTIDSAVEIDATGNADGVLRRIQVQVPLTNSNNVLPGYALQSNSGICKRFFVTPTYFANAGDVIDSEAANPMCDNNLPSSGTP